MKWLTIKNALDAFAAIICIAIVGGGIVSGIRAAIELPILRWWIAGWILFMWAVKRLLNRWT